MTSESATVAELASLASAFSAAADDSTRNRIAADYGEKLDELMNGGWTGALGAANELPDEFLPKAYLDQRSDVIASLHIQLADLAAVYRGVSEGSQEDAEAIREYHRVFDEMLRVIGGPFGLTFDAHLPKHLMPKAYNDFWR